MTNEVERVVRRSHADGCSHGKLWTEECRHCNGVNFSEHLLEISRICNKACAEIDKCEYTHISDRDMENAARAMQRMHNVLCNIKAMR